MIAVTLGIATLATMAGYASGKALSVPAWLLRILKLTDQ